MIPLRRELRFRLRSGSAGNWHVRGRCLAQFIEAMSISFPQGERQLIHTVRNDRDRVTKDQGLEAPGLYDGKRPGTAVGAPLA